MAMEFKPFIGYKVQKNQPNYSILKVALSEGKNRELRRFFAHFGAEVVDLKRISFAEVELNNLPEGKVRFLSRSEYSALSKFLKEEKKSELKELRELGKSDGKRSFKKEDNKSSKKNESKGFKKEESKSFKKNEGKSFKKDEKKPAFKSKKPINKKR
jgi:23S rRNA pseudouridine2605 synthase